MSKVKHRRPSGTNPQVAPGRVRTRLQVVAMFGPGGGGSGQHRAVVVVSGHPNRAETSYTELADGIGLTSDLSTVEYITSATPGDLPGFVFPEPPSY